jgi:hypothetical protein
MFILLQLLLKEILEASDGEAIYDSRPVCVPFWLGLFPSSPISLYPLTDDDVSTISVSEYGFTVVNDAVQANTSSIASNGSVFVVSFAAVSLEQCFGRCR